MDKRHRKILLMAAKLIVAVALLTWVVSQSFWRDYVTTRDGKSYALVETRQTADGGLLYIVSEGKLWWASEQTIPAGQLAPVEDKNGKPVLDNGLPILIRPGFARSIETLRWGLLACAMCGFLLSNLIVSVRWWFLLQIQDIRITLWEGIRLTFLGIFFNAVVPGTVGGDLVKAYYVSKHTPRKAAILVSIFVDRVLGLTELTLVAGVMILVVLGAGLETFENIKASVITVLVVIGLVIGALTFLLSARFRRKLHLQKIYQRLPIAHHIAAAGDAAELYRKRLPLLIKVAIVTLSTHLAWVGSIALVGMSLPAMAMQTHWYNFFVFIPLIYIIGAVPVTPGGVGLVEKLYIWFFWAVSPSTVLAMALLARFVPLIWALPGILVAVTGPKLPKAAEMEAELEGEKQSAS